MKGTTVIFIIVATFLSLSGFGQSPENFNRWVSLGVRSTVSAFEHDGEGLGTGGQFRIRLSDRVNTDWYADYIMVPSGDNLRSEYVHIGWSVLYYPFKELMNLRVVQPYVLAGHCFDYNKKTVLDDPLLTKDRWGSAVQAGIGSHFNLNERFDVSTTCQYMVHLTKALEVEQNHQEVDEIHVHDGPAYEGHMLITVSINYKIFRI